MNLTNGKDIQIGLQKRGFSIQFNRRIWQPRTELWAKGLFVFWHGPSVYNPLENSTTPPFLSFAFLSLGLVTSTLCRGVDFSREIMEEERPGQPLSITIIFC